jgi:hypothetical protein
VSCVTWPDQGASPPWHNRTVDIHAVVALQAYVSTNYLLDGWVGPSQRAPARGSRSVANLIHKVGPDWGKHQGPQKQEVPTAV